MTAESMREDPRVVTALFAGRSGCGRDRIMGQLTDFARDLSEHNFLAEKIWIRDTRMAHFDTVSKVAAIEVDGIDTGLRYDDLRNTFEANSGFSPESNTGKKLKNTFDFLDRVFPEKNAILRNRSTIQPFATLASLIMTSGKSAGCEESLLRFFEHFVRELSRQVELGQRATDPDYIQFQGTLSANVKAGAKVRRGADPTRYRARDAGRAGAELQAADRRGPGASGPRSVPAPVIPPAVYRRGREAS